MGKQIDEPFYQWYLRIHIYGGSMPARVRPQLTAVVLLLTLCSCAETLHIKSYPPGADVYINDIRLPGKAPTSYETKNPQPLHYRAVIDGFPPVEGTVSAPLAPGRVVAGVFTLGVL